MKKLIKLLACTALIAIFAITISACNISVAGQSYSFQSLVYDDTAFTSADYTHYDEMTTQYFDLYRGKLTFTDDGKVTHENFNGTYEQNGNSLKLVTDKFEADAEVSGKSIYILFEIGGFSFGTCKLKAQFNKV